MGSGFKCFCDKCGYSLDVVFGMGMLGFKVREKETKKMKAGKYGEQGKRFFIEHPDGSVTTDYVVVKCASCGELYNVYDFDLQIPEPEREKAKKNLRDALDKGDPKACKVNLLPQKDVFFIATAGNPLDMYFKSIMEVTESKQCREIGRYPCLGHDSFGPFKIAGGIQKGHPDESELHAAVEFYKNL